MGCTLGIELIWLREGIVMELRISFDTSWNVARMSRFGAVVWSVESGMILKFVYPRSIAQAINPYIYNTKDRVLFAIHKQYIHIYYIHITYIALSDKHLYLI